MFIDLASDLHIHHPSQIFSGFFDNPGEVLLLPGDVAPFIFYEDLVPFFNKVSETWSHTFFVPGNHEFYGSELFNTRAKLMEFFKRYSNIYYLDKYLKIVNNKYFIGSILWTNMDGNNEITKLQSQLGMNDFQLIHYGSERKLSPDDTMMLFNVDFRWLERTIEKIDAEVIVITHHAPSFQSIAQQYKNSKINGAFASNLDDFILDHPAIKLWVHGHVHSDFDYKIGDCRVVCHPMGYMHERKALYKPYKIQYED
jgi:UDP-2,3-diacylglucosamine pyrophosphatase LpxH